MGVGLWVLGGIIAFLCVEKFVRCVKGGHGHSHSPGHVAPVKTEEKKGEKKVEDSKKGGKAKKTEKKQKSPPPGLQKYQLNNILYKVADDK